MVLNDLAVVWAAVWIAHGGSIWYARATSVLYMFQQILMALGIYWGARTPLQWRMASANTEVRKHPWLWWLSVRQVLLLIILAVVSSGIAPSLISTFLLVGAFLSRQALTGYEREQANRQLQERAAESEVMNQRLQRYMVQAEDLAVEQERTRLAREIHDGLGHHLNNIKAHVGAAGRTLPADVATALDSLSIAKSETAEAQRELRRAIDALLSDHLAAPIEDLLTEPLRGCELAGITTRKQIIGLPRPVSESVKHALLRICQEALNNVRKHSHAQHVSLIVDYQDPHQVRITVVDDGIGIPPDTRHERGHGLNNMQERAWLVGGTTSLETAPGRGVRLLVEIPTP